MKAAVTWVRWVRRVIILSFAVGLIVGGWIIWNGVTLGGKVIGGYGNTNAGPSYKTEDVVEGTLVARISASGTLEPEETIDIGAQVQGAIMYFGRDPSDNRPIAPAAEVFGMMAGSAGSPAALNALVTANLPPNRILAGGWRTVDYSTDVEAGTVLAQLDDKVYSNQVLQSKLALLSAQANLAQLNATVQQTRVLAEGVERLKRAGPGTITDLDYEPTKANFDVAVTALEVGKVKIDQARASMEQNQINLDYTTIRAPVKGVIIDRRVNVGQTVVASLTAPSLFLLAKDLTRMQIWASVNEADVGNIQPGQRVTFKIDAFPGETFVGKVNQIRLNASNTQNVVIYTVVVDTDNRTPDGKLGKLKPYLTANMQFEVARRDRALLVTNAALRYRPPVQNVHPDFRKDYEKVLKKRTEAMPGEDAPPAQTGSVPAPKKSANEGMVWVADGPFLKPVHVRTGLTNGTQTEIVEVLDPGVQLTKGTPLVVGENPAGTGGNDVKNPFATNVFGKKKQ